MFKKISIIVAIVMLISLVLPINISGAAGEVTVPFDAAERALIRAAAIDAGLGGAPIMPDPYTARAGDFNDAGDFMNATDAPTKALLVQLGKALYWDQQVGSDGQACASCHFGGFASAFADSRTKNQGNPGLLAGDNTFNIPGPNRQLTPADFPVESNDVISSQGVFHGNYTGFTAGEMFDNGVPLADAVFNVAGVNVRFVPPRNTPSAINAVFNVTNFWDGRAHPNFNGVSPIGPLDAGAKILVNTGAALAPTTVSIPESSLASQSVGPTLSTGEMQYIGRTYPDVARKLMSTEPLKFQAVHPQDSVLSTLRQADGTGLNRSYQSLIQDIFQPRFWDSALTTEIAGAVNTPYTQIEMNFSLFWGLAVQAYESTLISINPSTPFDAFMAGDDAALTDLQLEGLLVFMNTGAIGDTGVFKGVSRGMCADCHAGPEFTNATYTALAANGGKFLGLEQMVGPDLKLQNRFAIIELGFANIGVRPTAEDISRGGVINYPLSFARQAQAGLAFAPEALPAGATADTHVAVDGSCKVPGLRNIEMTAPYMHNGGLGTLEQVFRFYQRRGDFASENFIDYDPAMAEVNLRGGDEDIVVAFLKSLTDDRVRNELAPFDHPALSIPHGHPGNETAITAFDTISTPAGAVKVAQDIRITIPATGNGGLPANPPADPPITTFPKPPPALDLPQTGVTGAGGTWNLISTPVTLQPGANTLAAIYGATLTNISAAYAWNGTAWTPVNGTYVLNPLDAVYVKVNDGTTAVATFVAAVDATAPPAKHLVAGLNLVGIAPNEVGGLYSAMLLDQALTTVAASGTLRGYVAVLSPGHQQVSWVYFPGAAVPNLEPFGGYWVIMDNEDWLYGFSTTP